MTHLRLLLVAAGIVVAATISGAAPVHAHDCAARIQGLQDVNNPDNIQDCIRTGNAYGVTIGAVVAGAGVLIAVVGLPGRRPVPPPPRPVAPQAPAPRREPEQPQPPQHSDPCFDHQGRVVSAQTTARTTFSALQTLRTQRAYLDTLWENTRETGYMSSVVDLAMIAGSLWSKPLATAGGYAIAKQALGAKVAEAMLKALGKDLAKDVMKRFEDQHIDWSDLLRKPPLAGGQKLLTEAIKAQLTVIEYNRAAAALAGSGKVPDIGAIEKEFSGPIADTVGQTLSLVTMGSSTLKVAEKMEAIRKTISSVDDSIFAAESLWESAVNELDLAHDSLNRCRELHGPAGA